jgi:hypothetical protein
LDQPTATAAGAGQNPSMGITIMTLHKNLPTINVALSELKEDSVCFYEVIKYRIL